MTASDPKHYPPGWAVRLLEWFCAPHRLEEVQGDLEEEFLYQVKHNGVTVARLDYIRNVFGFMRPFAVKRKSRHTSYPTINMKMLKHYLIVANRNVVKQKVFSAINILGLSLGMMCCLFIMLWIRDEKAMDGFHTDADQLFNVYETVTTNNEVTGSYATTIRQQEDRSYIPIADIEETVPEIEAINFYATGYELPWGFPETFQVGDKKHKFEGSRAGEEFFSIFNYTIIAGEKDHALKDVSSIAISRKMSEVFFDTPEEAIGKTIRYENAIDFKVVTVFEDVPVQSTLKFEFLINWESHMTRLAWATPNVLTTLRLKRGSDIRQVETSINRHVKGKLDPNDPRKVTLGLQPFADQYLHSHFVNGKPGSGRITYVNIFTGVAVFILIIACINFMNLATARSIKRAKEIGVRKVVGSSRAGLIGQFLGEAMVLSFFAMLITLVLVYVLLPVFNNFTGKNIVLPLSDPMIIFTLVLLMVATGFVAGSYPALFLSALQPMHILKGGVKFSDSAVLFRKSLSVFQFSISVILLIVTIVITRQTEYIQNAHLGYDRENLIYLRVEGELSNYTDPGHNFRKYAVFKNEALNVPGVVMVDRSSEAPHAMSFVVDENDNKTETSTGQDAINWEGKMKGVSVGFKPMSVGFDFLRIMNLQVVEGRGFEHDIASDSSDAFIVNEEAVKQMGMKDPIGKWISAWGKRGHIIGVIKDYHTHSLHEAMKPVIVDVKETEYFGVLLVRIEPGKTKEALAGLEKVYKNVNPNYPFAYQFIDQEYERLYRGEQTITKLTNIFAVIAITISCLGLLGLVMFSAEQRTREFGIRKVLGASAGSIVRLLSHDFLKLIMISFCIAAPIAGIFMAQWLDTFAYKISLSWWIFGVAGASAVLLALMTICFQALRSATANPAESLRSE